jgi:hypothetical protein
VAVRGTYSVPHHIVMGSGEACTGNTLPFREATPSAALLSGLRCPISGLRCLTLEALPQFRAPLPYLRGSAAPHPIFVALILTTASSGSLVKATHSTGKGGGTQLRHAGAVHQGQRVQLRPLAPHMHSAATCSSGISVPDFQHPSEPAMKRLRGWEAVCCTATVSRSLRSHEMMMPLIPIHQHSSAVI